MDDKEYELAQPTYNRIEKHYIENFNTLVKQFTAMSGGKHNAQDVVQEAYSRALQYWRSYDETKDFNRWLGRILFNCLSDNIREERTHGAMEDTSVVLEVPCRAFNKLLLEEVTALVNEQPENISYILTLYFFKGYKTVEIADLVPETHANIRFIIHDFRKRLKDRFGGQRLFE